MDISVQSNTNYYNSYSTNKTNTAQSNSAVNSTNTQTPQNENQNPSQERPVEKRLFTELPKQEIIALYYDYQETQLNKDMINIYSKSNESTDYSTNSVELSLKDIHQLNKQVNRGEVLEDIASMPKDEREIDKDAVTQYLEEIKPELEISQQEAVSLYYNRQANQLTKDIINIYAQNSESTDYSSTSTEVSLNDINELHKQLNKNQLLNNAAAS